MTIETITNKMLERLGVRWFEAVYEDDGSFNQQFEECEPVCVKWLVEWSEEEPGKFYWEAKDDSWGHAYVGGE